MTISFPAVVDDRQWQQLGACGGMEDARFFHPDNERGPDRAARERRAKRICDTCPVLEHCREHALAAREAYGVWGGLGEGERRAILDLRRRSGAPGQEQG